MHVAAAIKRSEIPRIDGARKDQLSLAQSGSQCVAPATDSELCLNEAWPSECLTLDASRDFSVGVPQHLILQDSYTELAWGKNASSTMKVTSFFPAGELEEPRYPRYFFQILRVRKSEVSSAEWAAAFCCEAPPPLPPGAVP